jgi:hypothetical protein
MANQTLANDRQKIAILIDGDNAQSILLPQMLVEAGRHGQVTVRRIYGDWTTSNMNSWKETLNFHAFQPIQQFRYTVGKNVTDSAMIIDAMDILHSGVVDGFCLVSSDSDYTRLATRIREAGVFVMGIGEKKTPKAFVNACDLFVYTENLVAERKAIQKKKTQSSRAKKAVAITDQGVDGASESEKEESDPMPVLSQAYEMAVGEDGWARLDVMGNAIYQLDPGFDPRTYGHKQLSRMLNKLKDKFEMRTKDLEGQLIFYVRIKE